MQVQTGTVDVHNGDSNVKASVGNDWGSVSAGAIFSVVGDIAQYEIIAVNSPGVTISGLWELTLGAPYQGIDNPIAPYAISVDFTPNLGLPLISPGDLQTALLLTRWAKQLDQMSQLIALNTNTGLTSESGSVDLPSGAVSPVVISFDNVKPTNTYDISAWIENPSDPNPSFIPVIITSKTTTGFTILVAGNPDTANYKLRWRVGNTIAPSNIGEYISASLAFGSATALVNNVGKTVCSIPLSAGDWEINGVVAYVAAASTSITRMYASIGPTDNTSQSAPNVTTFVSAAFVPGSSQFPSFPTPSYRFSLPSPAIIYLVALASFSVSTLSAFGNISARRWAG